MAKIKEGSLLINCGYHNGVDKDALFAELQSGRIRAAQDEPIDSRFNELPLSTWYCSNASTAYNTQEANQAASDMATQSLLNLLEKGSDQFKAN